MKILILNGSPKGERSATLKLARAFADGVRRDGDVLDLIDISKSDVHGCRGCFGCWANGGACVIRDDFPTLFRERYLTSDLVLWCFPLYFYEMPSQLKAFMDRTFVNNWPDMPLDENGRPTHPQRCDVSQMSHIIISTCGFYTAAGLYDAVLAHFRILYGSRFKEAVTCAQGGAFSSDSVKELVDAYLEKVGQAGCEYRETGEFSAKTKAALMEPLLPGDIYMSVRHEGWKYKENA